MIVTGARGRGALLAPGTEVLTVDGVAAGRLLRIMMSLARADGSNDAKRVAQLGINARDRYAAFDVYRPLLTSATSPGAVAVRVRAPDGRDQTLELPALTESEVAASRDDSASLGWRFDIGPDAIGRLTMPDWTTYNSEWDWRSFIDGVVDRLIDERARGLIVDVRGNEGGTECGWHLLERIVGRDTPVPAFVKRVRYRRLPQDLHAALDTWDDSFRDWGAAAEEPDGNGFYRLRRPRADLAVLRPRGRRFAGPVVVLVDAVCSSATFQFANAIAASRLATLVGEPTGGNRRGINGDAYFFVRLPASGLEVDLPIVGMFSAERQPNAGVRPDLWVPVAAADIAAGRDRQMTAALSQLRRS
jgi:C-terminal processing protease CtpA/Prc